MAGAGKKQNEGKGFFTGVTADSRTLFSSSLLSWNGLNRRPDQEAFLPDITGFAGSTQQSLPRWGQCLPAQYSFSAGEMFFPRPSLLLSCLPALMRFPMTLHRLQLDGAGIPEKLFLGVSA